MTKGDKESPHAQRISKVSRAAGGSYPLLPGESSALYEQGYEATLKELGVETELQIFLAEKIFQCLWWMRRYETQKQSVILEGMVRSLKTYSMPVEKRLVVRELIYGQKWNEVVSHELFSEHGHNITSLLEAAMSSAKDELIKLDQQIALRVKTLTQLQQSYEALVNRSVMQERLKLQNELLKRDLQAIEITEVKQVSSPQHDQPKTKSRK